MMIGHHYHSWTCGPRGGYARGGEDGDCVGGIALAGQKKLLWGMVQ